MRETEAATKLQLLSQLRARIINEMVVERWKDVWFFPERQGVRGWQGTQDILFVGLNPSSGEFPSRADRFLYEQLGKNGFENAHLTDVIKIRATGKRLSEILLDAVLLDQQRRYLLDEIDIIRPRFVVGMGQKATRTLRQWLPKEVIPGIPHYSPRIFNYDNRERFSRGMGDLRQEYDHDA